MSKTKGHTAVVLADGHLAQEKRVRIVGGNCYVRTKPNILAKKLVVAHANEQYASLGETSANGWVKISFKNKAGWVSGKYAKEV